MAAVVLRHCWCTVFLLLTMRAADHPFVSYSTWSLDRAALAGSYAVWRAVVLPIGVAELVQPLAAFELSLAGLDQSAMIECWLNAGNERGLISLFCGAYGGSVAQPLNIWRASEQEYPRCQFCLHCSVAGRAHELSTVMTMSVLVRITHDYPEFAIGRRLAGCRNVKMWQGPALQHMVRRADIRAHHRVPNRLILVRRLCALQLRSEASWHCCRC